MRPSVRPMHTDSRTTFAISLWCAPAFMTTAPPSVPGMPQANSSPDRAGASATQRRDSAASAAPHPARKQGVPSRAWNRDTSCRSRVQMTSPEKPLSGNRTLLPLPKMNNGQLPSLVLHMSSVRTNCSCVCGRHSRAAGPPIRKVVQSRSNADVSNGMPAAVSARARREEGIMAGLLSLTDQGRYGRLHGVCRAVMLPG